MATDPSPDGAADPTGGDHRDSDAAPQRTADGHREKPIESSFDSILEEGRSRMRRPWVDLLTTGTVGGIEVAFGVLALLYVTNETGSTLLGGLAFSIGFIALLLGHSELFTEGFLVPVTVVAAGEVRFHRLVKLWVGTLVGNLVGGFVMAAVVDEAFPQLHGEAVNAADLYLTTPLGPRAFCLALLGGAAITLLTRMHHGTDNVVAKMGASVGIAFLLAGIHLFHSVLDSLLAFAALLTGHAHFGWLHWLAWFGFVVLGNLLGGLGLTTMLRLLRSRQRVADYRIANDRRVPARTAQRPRAASAAEPF